MMIDDKGYYHIENDKTYKGLTVNRGVTQPDSFNENSVRRFIANKKKHNMSADDYVDAIFRGNITVLSQAITLIESARSDHQELARKIIIKCLPHSGKSVRIGITGVPGVGKSTFIESLGKHITSVGGRLAVLAIDPSSERSRGSILGDKTRMETLSADPGAYIRPSPAAGSLGGVARKTCETIILCEAAGFDTIFIETVGVGQSETAVHSMVDLFLLLMLAGAGDELQGIKRGIMEMADIIAINKADGDNIPLAEMAAVQYSNALRLFPPADSGWKPRVVTCSAVQNTGIAQIWETIDEYICSAKRNGYFHHKRNEQAKFRMYETINEHLQQNFYRNHEIKRLIPEAERKILNEEISSFDAASILLESYYKSQCLKNENYD